MSLRACKDALLASLCAGVCFVLRVVQRAGKFRGFLLAPPPPRNSCFITQQQRNSLAKPSLENSSLAGSSSSSIPPARPPPRVPTTEGTWRLLKDGFSGELSPGSDSAFIMPALFGIICLLGILGNSLVICTVLKKSNSSSCVPDIFIINLSMVDLLFLLGMPFLIHQLLGNGAWHFGETMCTIITALDANSQFTSTYILTAMSIDRYLATVYPFSSTRFRKPPVAILAICVLWALSFLSITPVWMYTQLIPLPGGLLGCGIRLPDPERDIYWYTLYQFFLGFAIPFALITVAYRRILLRMARSSQALASQRSTRVRTKKVTRIAIAICLAFFVCWAPFHVLQLVQLAMHQPSLPFYYAYKVAISLGYANSCLNPFIYILLGQNIRKRIIVSVRPATAGEDPSHNRLKSTRGEPSESGQPLLHLVSVSAK
ncbi:melanin-concentrating hormone receptor 1-like isoform X1 [Hemicordylus capensis]|uniref:melanin-concentrating hormone receptor 1-like isoform X1 n=1 Tax=Hemicordylus capensis TaxID=884348 RepID=UPI00230371B6|nr:melanin-concentrating hormone receptor 1-like isoform X1 [Hemicordylus capensis]